MWGDAINRLVKLNGGLLIATVYPIDGLRSTGRSIRDV